VVFHDDVDELVDRGWTAVLRLARKCDRGERTSHGEVVRTIFISHQDFTV
jgi:hypothetical protein